MLFVANVMNLAAYGQDQLNYNNTFIVHCTHSTVQTDNDSNFTELVKVFIVGMTSMMTVMMIVMMRAA